MNKTVCSSDKLLLIADLQQLATIGPYCGICGDETIVTPDFDVAQAMSDQPCSWLNLWDYLSSDEIEAHEIKAWQFCGQLAATFKGRICCRGVDVVDCCRNDLFFSFNAVLNITLAVGRVLDQIAPGEVRYCQSLKNALYWDPPQVRPDIFNAVIEWSARIRGIKCVPVEGENKEDVKQDCPVASNSDGRFVPLAWNVRGLSFCEGKVFASEQALYWDHIEKQGDASMLFISTSPPEHSVPFLDIQALRRMPIQVKFEKQRCELFAAELISVLSEMFGNAFETLFENELSFVVDDFVLWLQEAEKYCEIGRFLRLACGPKVVLTSYDVYGRMRSFAEVFRVHQIPVMSIDHVGLSMIHNARRNRGGRNGMAVWGSFDAAAQRKYRNPGAVVCEVGSLRRDIAALKNIKRSNPAEVIENSTPSKNIVVFTTTTTRSAAMWTWAPPNRLAKSWAELIELFAVHPEWHLIIKCHPRYDYHNFYRNDVLAHLPNARIEIGAASDILADSDVAVLMNVPSKVCLECMACGIPVIYLRDAVLPHFYSPLKDSSIPVVTDVPSLGQELSRIMQDSVCRERVVFAGDQFLNKALVASGEKAVDRFVACMDDLIDVKIGDVGVSQPDLVSRWILDLMMLLGAVRNGSVKRRALYRHLGGLRRQRHKLVFDAFDFAPIKELGVYLLEEASAFEWWVGTIFRLEVMLRVYWLLPKGVRPTFRMLMYHIKLVFTRTAE